MRVFRIAILLISVSTFLLAADSPFTGTWTLNLSKGHLTPPIPKSSTARIKADDTGLALDQDWVDDKGQTSTIKFDAKFDGKTYPVTGMRDYDSVSLQRLSDHRVKATFKKAGKVVSVSDVIVSKDGKNTIVSYTDYADNGKPVKGSAVYDKQQ
jgi:hypothetical protein